MRIKLLRHQELSLSLTDINPAHTDVAQGGDLDLNVLLDRWWCDWCEMEQTK